MATDSNAPAMPGRGPRVALAAATGYACCYGAALAWLARSPAFEAGESLAALLIFGIGYSAVAWGVTRGCAAPPPPVRAPARETGLLVGYLALFAFAVLGVGLSAVQAALPDGRLEQTGVLALKLATMVALPVLLLLRRGYRWRELAGVGGLGRHGVRVLLVMGALLLGLQFAIGRGAQAVAALQPSAGTLVAYVPLAYAWMSVEAGLTEEVLFRLLLQTRLAAWLRSEVAGVFAMALVFGLAHAPGYVLRGAHLMEGMAGPPDALTAAAYAIAVVSPIGLMFGVLWARTRSLWLLVLLHGWTDLLPNLAPFIRTWSA